MTRQRFPKLLRPFVVLLLGIAIINLMATSGRAGDDHKTFKKQPYQGSLDRKYTVHVPDNIDRLPKPVPLVVVLHGCDEDNDKIQHDTNFDAVADQEGFITLYPYITDSSRQNACWGWWMPEEIHKGKGEVEDLNLLIQEVQKNYPIDKTRTHITGISAGGGMAVDVMMAHPELIASGATTAGLPYSETTGAVSWFVCELPGSFNSVDQDVSAMDAEMGGGKKFIPIYIVHSYGDCMLKIQASKNIRDAWGKEFGIDTANPTASESGETLGTAWTHTTYGDSSKRIETLFVGAPPSDGPNHGWYGGRGDGKYTFPNAPNTALLMWNFFKSFYSPTLTVSITNAAADSTNHSVRVEGKVTNACPPGAVTVTVELLGRSHRDASAATVNPADGTFVFTSESGLQDNTYYRPQVTAKDVCNQQSTALGSPVALGNPTDKPPVLTIDNVLVDKDCADLTGTARDVAGLDSVNVRIDGKNWMPAVINHETWTYKVCGLAPGKHEAAVCAMDKAALDSCATPPTQFVIPQLPVAQSSDLVGHMVASRVREYPGGFGSADKSIMVLINEHSMNNPFFLYEAPGTQDWYADAGNIPKAGSAMAPRGVAVPLEGVKRLRAMRRTSGRDLKPVPCPCP
jgi:poly(hydroxyalkanoate) depolymerase family esterase